MPLILVAVVSATALTGCAAITDQLRNEISREYPSRADLVAGWEKTAPWLPDDATDIRVRETRDGAPAVLLATSAAALDSGLCVETERRSAPTFDLDGAPDAYTETVFACGDWAVIPVQMDLTDDDVNRIFRALADATRRDIVRRTLVDEVSVSQLASAYDMSFAAVQKHVAVLEEAKLVTKEPRGRERMVRGEPDRIRQAQQLLDQFEQLWRSRIDRLDALLDEENH